ncbi:MAG: ABC transporter substrate-binding protein [Verrucomicrobia bacterium]|nr:ABC transporter substrate-binding protein [Verrucomicrobiota bacterium]
MIATDTYTIGHSPDPDDAFMFYAIAAEKIDLRGYKFRHQLEDIETLNERAMRGELEISAVSIHAYAHITAKYALLSCGASMGDGYGPLLVCPHEMQTSDAREWLRGKTIAVPGTMTSAFLALQLYLGEFQHVVVPFDQIFNSVKSRRAEAGLIIHEGQLTYARAGFHKIIDLGEWWTSRTGLPLPLGGNVLRKDMPLNVQRDLAAILRESIDYGLAHREEAVRHSMPYARDMDDKLASRFIGMYVNEYTRDYGERGREAIRRFLGDARAAGYVAREVTVEFVE